MNEQTQDGQLPQEKLDLINPPDYDLPPDPLQLSFDDLGGSEESTETSETEEATEQVEETQGVVETPVETATEQPRLSENLARVARAERELRQQRQELERERAELAELRELKEAASKGSKLSLMEKLGVTYDDLTQEYISGEGTSPDSRLRDEVAQLQKRTEQQLEAIRQAEANRQLAEERKYLRESLSAAADDFPFITALESYDLVHSAVQSHYKEHGEIVSYDDAAQVVEESLGELYRRGLSNPKVRAKFADLFAETSPEESSTETKAEVTPRTLSNTDTQTRTMLVDDEFDPVTASDEELIERLAPTLKYTP